jgi:hypothetical protein
LEFDAGQRGGACRITPPNVMGNSRRKLEQEARAIAAGMTDPQARPIMLFIAQGYRRLADRADFLKDERN